MNMMMRLFSYRPVANIYQKVLIFPWFGSLKPVEEPMEVVKQELIAYDDDFTKWAFQQANLLRDVADKNLVDQPVDWIRIAEELEDLGRLEQRSARSLIGRIIQHLLLLEYRPDDFRANESHWRGEIESWRADLEDYAEGDLNAAFDELPTIYRRFANVARQKLARAARALPSGCPYSRAQILKSDWFPEERA